MTYTSLSEIPESKWKIKGWVMAAIIIKFQFVKLVDDKLYLEIDRWDITEKHKILFNTLSIYDFTLFLRIIN